MKHRAKKSLGQNFLKSEPALRKIAEAGEIQKGDVILEIGPGRGALTEKLLQAGAKVIAVEKDNELFEFLKIKFEKEINNDTLILVCEDILNFDINKTPSPQFELEHSPFAEGEKPYKIVANIPYNITGAILKKFLTEKIQPERMVLMVQHEVAKRIVARDGKESILSISVKAYGEPKMIMKVPARYFSPSPKVDSAVIVIKNISRKTFTTLPPPPFDKLRAPPPSQGGGKNEVQGKTLSSLEFEERFWKIVKAGFAHKRKKLSSNLKTLKNGSLASVLGNKRAEDLTLSDWVELAKI